MKNTELMVVPISVTPRPEDRDSLARKRRDLWRDEERRVLVNEKLRQPAEPKGAQLDMLARMQYASLQNLAMQGAMFGANPYGYHGQAGGPDMGLGALIGGMFNPLSNR